MMGQHIITEKSAIPEYGDSKRFETKFKFDLYSCILANFNNKVYIVVGYKDNGYILLKESKLEQNSDGDFEIIGIDNLLVYHKDFIESQCTKVDHGSEKYSLCKAKVGDTVVCIARNRYQGVSIGEKLVVTSMPENRLSLSKKSVATYESKYFMVIKRPAINMMIASSQSLVDYKRSILSLKGGSNFMDFPSSVVVNLTHKKNHIRMLEVEGIIERPRDVTFDRIRPIFKPELIEKQK